MATDLGVPARFATTRWSVVAAAGGADSAAARQALGWLCEAYWQPLHEHVRRRGHAHDSAQDVVQAFFARLIEKRDLAPERGRGRFRSYLLGALDHFLANQRDRERALKRGGGRVDERIDGADEPAHERTPEREFTRSWALALLQRVMIRLEAEHAGERRRDAFAAIRRFLTANADAGTYAEAGARVGMSEGAVKVAVHRLRGRYRQLLRDEIAETVADPAEIDDELRDLLAALA